MAVTAHHDQLGPQVRGHGRQPLVGVAVDEERRQLDALPEPPFTGCRRRVSTVTITTSRSQQ
jgi:hypothetical protein